MPSQVTIRARSTVGVAASPFTGEQQVYVHQGEVWEMDVTLPPMIQADAEEWVGFLLALNGRQGTFLMGDPALKAPRGNWGGSPVVSGSVAIGVKSLPMRGFSVGATVKAGDWFQYSSGANTHLHKIVQDGTADGSGNMTLELWPRLRVALSDGAVISASSPKGIWRLATNVSEWTVGEAKIYGMQFQAVEAL